MRFSSKIDDKCLLQSWKEFHALCTIALLKTFLSLSHTQVMIVFFCTVSANHLFTATHYTQNMTDNQCNWTESRWCWVSSVNSQTTLAGWKHLLTVEYLWISLDETSNSLPAEDIYLPVAMVSISAPLFVCHMNFGIGWHFIVDVTAGKWLECQTKRNIHINKMNKWMDGWTWTWMVDVEPKWWFTFSFVFNSYQPLCIMHLYLYCSFSFMLDNINKI